MRKEFAQKLNLATDLLKIIITMAEQGEDYSLIKSNYNLLVERYDLPLQKIKYVSLTEFEFLTENLRA